MDRQTDRQVVFLSRIVTLCAGACSFPLQLASLTLCETFKSGSQARMHTGSGNETRNSHNGFCMKQVYIGGVKPGCFSHISWQSRRTVEADQQT